jgi:hypothetical protein
VASDKQEQKLSYENGVIVFNSSLVTRHCSLSFPSK